jgi:pyruvate dehydrogenase E2 component (dihydrolipoamide acetyltransferase)
MLVSAAMAERPRASAAGRSQPASSPPAAQRHSTARVAPTQGVRRTELPGWFWGALGCLTVLVVGLSVVFVLGQSGAAPTPAAAATQRVETAPVPAAAAPAAPAQAAEAQKPGAPSIHIEPMAAPAAPVAPAAAPAAAPASHQAKPHGAAHPIKVARSPSVASKATGASKPAADESDDDSGGDDAPKTKRKAASSDDDEAPAKRTSAEDEASER